MAAEVVPQRDTRPRRSINLHVRLGERPRNVVRVDLSQHGVGRKWLPAGRIDGNLGVTLVRGTIPPPSIHAFPR